MSWARLLKRVFHIENCLICGGTLKIIAAIEDPPVIVRYLAHLGLPKRTRRVPPPNGESIHSKRCDPQARIGSAKWPTIRLSRHSRRQSDSVDIRELRPKRGPKIPLQQRDFYQTFVRLTTRRCGAIAPVRE